MLKYPKLFSPNHQILLIDCELQEDMVLAKISRFDANLKQENYELKENAVISVCQIKLPEWAISNEPLIFLEQIELEIVCGL